MNLRFKNLTLKGFKNHVEEKSFDFNDYTVVIGDNGLGKTTVGEGLSYVMYGCSLTGNDKADSLLLNKASDKIYGSAVFEVYGKEHTIIRKRGKAVELYLDGKKTTQTELAKILPPKDVFLAIFSPEFFMTMGETKGRNFLMDVLPLISKEIVISKMGQFSAGKLQGVEFLNANVLLSEKRARLVTLDEELNYSQGAYDTKVLDLAAIVVPELKIFDSDRLLALKAKLKDVSSEEPEGLLDIDYLKSERTRLEKELIVLDGLSCQDRLEDAASLEKALSNLEGVLSSKQDMLNEMALDEGVCPHCYQAVSAKHIEAVKSKMQAELNTVLDKISGIKAQITDMIKRNALIYAEFAKEVEEKKAALNKQISELCIEDFTKNNENILNDFKNAQLIRVAELEGTIRELETQRDAVNLHNTNRASTLKLKEQIERDIEKLGKDLVNTKEEKVQVIYIIDALKEYNSTFVKLQAEYMAQYLSKVTLRLQKLVKSSGEVKDCFEVLYEGREYKLLSNSERIKAGLEIANLIMGVTGVVVPIFVDNAESITLYSKPTTQVIESRVIKDQPLTIIDPAAQMIVTKVVNIKALQDQQLATVA